MWMRTAPSIEVYRVGDDGAYTVDRPALGQFRQAFSEPLPDDVVPVVTPSTIDTLCGWYRVGDRTILLAQVPEAYWGEPMIMILEGDVVRRAYATGEHTLVREDGETFDVAALQRSPMVRESDVQFKAGGVTLAGTLITPAGPGPYPAAVMVHGAAGGQRDFVRLFADPVLAAGVAVLIYDKRGHGRSGGTEPTIFEQADAADAALDLLGRTAGIDPDRRGLIGFSNGMWSAPMVAGRRDDVAFMAGVGSPGVSMADCEVHRRTKVLRDAGVGQQTLDIVEAVWRRVFRMAAMGAATDDDVDRLAELLAALSTADDLDRYEIPDYVRENPMLAPYPPAEIPAAAIAAMVTAEPSPDLAYAPAVDYARLHCPVFLQWGSNDVSVPVGVSVETITAAQPSAQTRVYPGVEHTLNRPPRELDGLGSEEAQYLFHDFRFAPGVRDELTAWLRTTLI
jgi:pimeloyl-ACP methyl ester carboxylesterase